MKTAEEYVTDAWTVLERSSIENELEALATVFKAAMTDAHAEGMQLGSQVQAVNAPHEELADELVTAAKEETYKCYQFEHATVQYWEKFWPTTGKIMPRVYVQVIDDYHFQREWSLQYRHRSGDSKALYWESHIYQHPGRRCVKTVSTTHATKLLATFLEYCEKYPNLLFGKSRPDTATNKGFVWFAEALHAGANPHYSLF